MAASVGGPGVGINDVHGTGEGSTQKGIRLCLSESKAGAEDGRMSIEEGFLLPYKLDRPLKLGEGESDVPVIDVGAAVQGGGDEGAMRVLVELVGRACQEWGSFKVINHGIPPSVIDRLRQASKDFFDLPSKVKLQVKKHTGGLGYFQGQLTNNIRDWREVFDMSATGYLELHDADFLTDNAHTCIFQNQWPSDVMPLLRETCEEYMLEAQRLAFTLVKLMWQSLGLKPTQFEDYFVQSKAHRFRFNHYPVCSTPDLVLGIGAHTDVGALTVLLQDEVGGLQVRRKDGEWIDVQPDPTSIIINVADVMQVLTNDKYKSVEHRVMVNKNIDRYSFSFSFNPASWVNVSPIIELTNELNPPKYKSINWGKYTKGRIDGSLNKFGDDRTKLCYFKAN